MRTAIVFVIWHGLVQNVIQKKKVIDMIVDYNKKKVLER